VDALRENAMKAALGSILHVTTLVLLLAGNAAAEDWAGKLFGETSHDFGTLARGSKAEWSFSLENVYEEDVHIAGIRSSCGCATAEIVRPTLKTWEKGAVLVKFNTRSFLGHKDATISVVLDKPYAAEVQLTVSGYVRSDVVLNPGVVDFGEQELGTAAAKTLAINYAGREDWRITDVRSANGHFEASLTETRRGDGRVGYELTVHLGENMPPGDINEQLVLVTNDTKRTNIPFMVTGRVLPPVTVNPAALAMGVVSPGHTVTKQLVVRAKKPFRITAVHCKDESFAFQVDEKVKPLHLIPVTFTAGEPGKKLARQIRIETDLAPESPATCMVTAEVKAVAGGNG
jgi:hypothetical protein